MTRQQSTQRMKRYEVGWASSDVILCLWIWIKMRVLVCVIHRLLLTRELMNSLPTSTAWQILKCSSPPQTDPEGWVSSNYNLLLDFVSFNYYAQQSILCVWSLRRRCVWFVSRPLFFCVSQRTVRFCEQLATVVPNAHVYYRRGLALKRIIPQCVARDFTYLMVVNEDRQTPSILKGSCACKHKGEISIYLSFSSLSLIHAACWWWVWMVCNQNMEIFDTLRYFLTSRSLTVHLRWLGSLSPTQRADGTFQSQQRSTTEGDEGKITSPNS